MLIKNIIIIIIIIIIIHSSHHPPSASSTPASSAASIIHRPHHPPPASSFARIIRRPHHPPPVSPAARTIHRPHHSVPPRPTSHSQLPPLCTWKIPASPSNKNQNIAPHLKNPQHRAPFHASGHHYRAPITSPRTVAHTHTPNIAQQHPGLPTPSHITPNLQVDYKCLIAPPITIPHPHLLRARSLFDLFIYSANHIKLHKFT